jgi:uncharacterized protein YdbL (DUF1318 family)
LDKALSRRTKTIAKEINSISGQEYKKRRKEKEITERGGGGGERARERETEGATAKGLEGRVHWMRPVEGRRMLHLLQF